MPEKSARKEHKPYRVRIPGFVREEDIGAGKALKYVTTRVGIRPCNGCGRRAAAPTNGSSLRAGVNRTSRLPGQETEDQEMSHDEQAQPDLDLEPERDVPEQRISAAQGPAGGLLRTVVGPDESRRASVAADPHLAGVTTSYRPGPDSYVYAIGKIDARYPRLSIEKEFAQVAGRADTACETDDQVFYEVLLCPREQAPCQALCWVLTVREIETYILLPATPQTSACW